MSAVSGRRFLPFVPATFRDALQIARNRRHVLMVVIRASPEDEASKAIEELWTDTEIVDLLKKGQCDAERRTEPWRQTRGRCPSQCL